MLLLNSAALVMAALKASSTRIDSGLIAFIYKRSAARMEMSSAVRRFKSLLGSPVGMGAAKGVFVTTSKFSQEATEFAKHLTQRIILIDGQRLAELMIEHGVGVRLTIEFKRLDENFFYEDD